MIIEGVHIGGFKPASMLERPGLISSIIFAVGCNLRCPFCHNPELISEKSDVPPYPLSEIMKMLMEKRDWIDSVIFTGGEPTLQPGMEIIMRKVKDEGFQVGLHTNGTNPLMIDSLLRDKILSYLAMDIKNSREKYTKTIGTKRINFKRIEESIELVKSAGSTIDTIFRTTVVPGYVEEADIDGIGELIKGAPAASLQQFRTLKCLAPELENAQPYDVEVLHRMADKLEHYVGHVEREFI